LPCQKLEVVCERLRLWRHPCLVLQFRRTDCPHILGTDRSVRRVRPRAHPGIRQQAPRARPRTCPV